MNNNNEINHIENRATTLVERMLQRITVMTLDRPCLLILLYLQNTKRYQTLATLSEQFNVPIPTVRKYVEMLIGQHIVKAVNYTERKDGKMKTFHDGFIIDYEESIEYIVYKYSKLMTTYNQYVGEEEIKYRCNKCRIEYEYEEALKYMNSKLELECGECGMKLEYVKPQKYNSTGKLSNMITQFKGLKEEMEMLQSTYSNVKDYPPFERPEEIKKQNEEGKKEENNTMMKNRFQRIRNSMRRMKTTEMLPWEEEEDHEIINETEEEKEEEKTIFEMIDIERYNYLKPDGTFKEIREVIPKKENLLKSNSSPGAVRPSIIKPARIKRTGYCSRAVSTSPQTPQLF